MRKNKIQQRLDEIGRSQGWLSRQTGLSREYINKLISGRIKNPGVLTCKKIAKVLGRYVDELWV